MKQMEEVLMATKTSNKTTAARKPAARKTTATKMVATFPEAGDPERAEALAKLALRPSVNAAAVMTEYTQALGDVDIGALVASLSDEMDKVGAGDMKRVEAMLYGQASALQAIFMNLARRATKQEYMKQWEAYLRMALKAQNQCRMTLETLATIKNPPVVIARQANINNGGQQQVNNGTPPAAGLPSRANEFETRKTELLETSDGQGLDTRATGEASSADPHLETVGAIHRPPHR